jgi:competence protein ComEC
MAGHHGSRYSTCSELLEAVKPEVAFISAGSGNSFGHPTGEVLRRLNYAGAEIYRTDLMGDITMRFKP